MEQPGDYCITYNGALVQKAGDGSTVAQTALSYDDYRFLEQLSREVGSHFHALDRNTLYTANRDISYYTVHESYVATIPLVFCEAEKMDPEIQLLKVMMIDEAGNPRPGHRPYSGGSEREVHRAEKCALLPRNTG